MQRLLPCFSAPEADVGGAVCSNHAEPSLPDTTPLQAWQHHKLTLGFSGGGFLLPYHLGVYQALAIMGIADAGTPMAGASAGSLVVAGIKCGLSLQQQMESFMQAARECRQSGVAGRLRAVLKAQLNRTMPPDAHVRCSDGTCWLSITQVLPRPANKLYGGFSSRKQFIKALLASCHLPRVSDGGLFTSYKSIHKRCFDGGFSNLVPVPPAPPPAITAAAAAAVADGHAPTHQPPSSMAAADDAVAAAADAGVTVATFARDNTAVLPSQLPTAPAAAVLLRQNSTKAISTQLNTSKNSSSQSSSRAGVRVGSIRKDNSRASTAGNMWASLASHCIVAGGGAYVAAEGWFAVRVCVLPSQQLDGFPAMFRAPTADEVSIALDKFQAWPHNLEQTTNMALYPQDDDFLWDLFERGRADALCWAQQQGFPQELLQRLTAPAATAAGATGDVAAQTAAAGFEVPPELQVVRPLQQQEQPAAGQQKSDMEKEQQAATVAAAAAGVNAAAAGVATVGGLKA